MLHASSKREIAKNWTVICRNSISLLWHVFWKEMMNYSVNIALNSPLDHLTSRGYTNVQQYLERTMSCLSPVALGCGNLETEIRIWKQVIWDTGMSILINIWSIWMRQLNSDIIKLREGSINPSPWPKEKPLCSVTMRESKVVRHFEDISRLMMKDKIYLYVSDISKPLQY